MKTRYCSGTIVYRIGDKIRFLLITNTKQTKWGFPKGGLESGLTPEANALKELLEEAGATATTGFSLGTYTAYSHKDNCLQTVELFANEFGGYSGDGEAGRALMFVDKDEALKMLPVHLSPFLIRLYDHLKMCKRHEDAKQ